jgi:hypothetical protein
VILAAKLGPHTGYASTIAPAVLLVGLGVGLVFGCGTNTATYGAAPADSGGLRPWSTLPGGRSIVAVITK